MLGSPSSRLVDRPTHDHAPVEHRQGEPGARVTRRRIGGLDGLRAVAVIAVVAYHLWPDAVPAGYLGVDLFMVLSGFLITALLLDARHRHGSVRLGAFWARRFRRLVPALLALLAGVAVWVRIAGPATLEPTVRDQGIASLFYVGNWKLIADGTSYAALSPPASPLLHLWSLAIEEQFYLIWPIVVAVVLATTKGRRPLAVLTGVGAIASAVAMAAWFQSDTDPLRLYFGTDTRAQAFLIGALAALVVARVGSRAIWGFSRWAGLPAFGLLLLAFLLGDYADVLYHGGFAVFAVLAAMATVAVTIRSPLSELLDRAPLRVIGRVSYGIYLWHWPVIVLVTADTCPFTGNALLLFRLALIASATAISWFLIEVPYRRARRPWAISLGVAGIAVAFLSLITMPSESLLAYADVDVSRVPTPVVVAPPSTVTPVTRATATQAVAPSTVMIIGDSGMFDVTPALSAGFNATGAHVVETAYAGEGLTRPAGVRDGWAATVDEFRPDLVVVMLGPWDLDFIEANGDDAYRAEIRETVTMLTAHGARVLWLSVLPGQAVLPTAPVQQGKTVREELQDRFFAALPALYPDRVEYVDISASLTADDGTTPRVVDGQLVRKPDGWHLCPDGAAAVAHAVLAHLRLDRSDWTAGSWRSDPRFDDPRGGCSSS